MRVKILNYDQVKGRGIYQGPNDSATPFTYKQFRDEIMIPPGEYAELMNNKLHPVTLSIWEKIKEVIKSWLS